MYRDKKESLHTSQVAHQAGGVYLSFIKQLGVHLLQP